MLLLLQNLKNTNDITKHLSLWHHTTYIFLLNNDIILIIYQKKTF